MLTQERVKELFDYKDGRLYWRVCVGRSVVAALVGQKQNRGYLAVNIGYKKYLVHRIIFLWHHGYFPKELDHIDGNRSNHNIENLRPSTSSENNYNMGMRSDNTSGVKGVSWNKARRKWHAYVAINRRRVFSVYYDTLTQAEQAVKVARIKHHGAFANHGEQIAQVA